MSSDEYSIQRNNRNEKLNKLGNGIHKEVIEKKYHKLFDIFDTNRNGRIDSGDRVNGESVTLFERVLRDYAGKDGILSTSESEFASSVLNYSFNMADADYAGFVKAVSDAVGTIEKEEESVLSDGCKKVVTQYKDGITITSIYYPDGELKLEHVEEHHRETTTTYTMGKEEYTKEEIEKKIKADYEKKLSEYKANESKKKAGKEGADITFDGVKIPTMGEYTELYMRKNKVLENSDTKNIDRSETRFSERAKEEIRKYTAEYLRDTSEKTYNTIQQWDYTNGDLSKISMGITQLLEKGWEEVKGLFTDVNEQDFKTYAKIWTESKDAKEKAEILLAAARFENIKETPYAQAHPEMNTEYSEEFQRATGKEFSYEDGYNFQQTAQKYTEAVGLRQRTEALERGIERVRRLYENERVRRQGFSVSEDNETYRDALMRVLAEYFNGDKEMAATFIAGYTKDMTSAEEIDKNLLNLLTDIKKNAEAQYTKLLDGESYEELSERYHKEYREYYGTADNQDRIEELIGEAAGTRGMIKIAGVMIFSTLCGAALGTSAVSNGLKALAEKYGANLVKQGVRLAMTTNTVAADAGIEILDALSSEAGITDRKIEEIIEVEKGAAKYIFFGSYVAGPLAQSVSRKIAEFGKLDKAFSKGVTTTTAEGTTTGVSGEQFLKSMMDNNKYLGKAGALVTEIGAYAALDIATEEVGIKDALTGSANMMVSLKVLSRILQTLMGGRVNEAVDVAFLNTAMKRAKLDKMQMTETKLADGRVKYGVEFEGKRYETDDINDLAALLTTRLAMAGSTIPGAEGKPAPKSEAKVEDKAKTEPAVQIQAGDKTNEQDNKLTVSVLENMSDADRIAKCEELLKNGVELNGHRKAVFLEDGSLLTVFSNGLYQIEVPADNTLGYSRRVKFNARGGIDITDVQKNEDGTYTIKEEQYRNKELRRSSTKTSYHDNTIDEKVKLNSGDTEETTSLFKDGRDIGQVHKMAGKSLAGFGQEDLISQTFYYLHNEKLQRTSVREFEYSDGTKSFEEEYTENGEIVRVVIKRDGTATVNGQSVTVEEAENKSRAKAILNGATTNFSTEERQPLPDGYVMDKATGKPIKVDVDKIQTKVDDHGNGGIITITDEFGNELGHAMYEIRNDAMGKGQLYGFGLASKVSGIGIGTRLTLERAKIARGLGIDFVIDAQAGDYSGMSHNKFPTNLKYHYQSGFRAYDEGINKLVEEAIEKGYKIPVSINETVPMKFEGSIEELENRINAKKSAQKTTDNPEAKEEVTAEDVQKSEADFLNMLESSARKRIEQLFDKDVKYTNATNEEKMKIIFGLYNQAKIYGTLKDNYIPEFENVKQKAELVEDAKIKSYIDNELENLNKLPESDRSAKLMELEYLADAINNLNGKYSMLHTQSSKFDNPAAQSHRVQSIFAKEGFNFKFKSEHQDKIDEHIKYDGLKNFITKYSDINPEMAKYLYSIYIENLSPEIKAKCEEIEKVTGTRIFVDNTDPELMQHLNDTQEEFTLWKNAGLKVPAVIDQFDCDATYLLVEMVGKLNNDSSVFVAYTEKESNSMSISAYNMKANNIDYKTTLRHELTHLNDPNFDVVIWDNNNPVHNEILSNKEKYAQLLRDVGADEKIIEYALSMPREFSAVAMQLDTSKYPEEFKSLLVKMGVPEKVFEFEPVTKPAKTKLPQQVMDRVKELNAKWYPIENTHLTEKERQELINDSINMIIKQVSQGIEDNPDLIMERLEKLDKNRGYGFTYILSGRCKNAGFLIDNIEVINDKILTREKAFAMGADIFDFLDNLNENNLQKAIQAASKPDFVKNIKGFIYECNQHKVELGDRTVEVDSSDVIAIISGIQSLSYFRDGNSNSFENTTKSLVELENVEKAQQYYYQIVEGILVQRPELVEIADDLREYIDRQKIINPNKDMSEIQQEFFDELEKSGKLPKTITLQTVVPDKNALIEPQATFNLFKQGLTEGAKSLAQKGHLAENSNAPVDNNGHTKLQINSLDDFVNEIYALVSQGSNEPIKEEDIAEFKEDAVKNNFYDKYKKYQAFFDEFLSKDSEGKYFWGNENRYDQLYKIANKCFEDEFENPQEALEQFNKLAPQYRFTEAYANDKNADYKKFGITEKRAAFIMKMVDDNVDGEWLTKLDDYDVNNIVEYVSGVKSDADIDYMLSLNMPIKQAANIAAKITTQSERDNFAMISNGTFDKNNNENRLGNDLMISLAKIMEVPGGRERIENILKIEDFRKRIDLLKGYDRYSLNPEHTSYFNKITKYKLFEYDKLTPYDIEKLVYMDEEQFDVAVKRGLFTNPDVKGENISQMARWADEQFDVYNKLKTEMSFDEDNAYYAAQSIYRLPEYFEKYDLANLPQIKTKDELYDFINYLGDNDRARLLTRPEIRKATHLNYNGVKNLLTIDDEHWPRVTRRGLLENPELSKTGSHVTALSNLDEETYQALLSRGFADRISRKEQGWVKYMLANLSDEQINRYFELRDNPPVDPNQRSIDTEDLIKLAQLDRTVYDKVVQFLYMEDRKSYFSQFKVDELQKLFENYPDEDSFEKFKELVDMQILKDQGTNQLDFKEINKLLELYNNGKTNPDEMKKFDDVIELITNDGRNRNKNRLTVDAASYIIYNRHNTYTENRNPETGEWTRTEIDKTDLSNRLVYIPERGNEQYNYNDITGIMSAINSVEDLEKYNDFIYSAKRKENSCKQLTGTDFMTISSIKDNETLQVAKDLIYVEKRGMHQFNGREIVALAELTPEERAQAEKYYHIPNRSQQFSGQMLAYIGKYTPEQLERLDKLLSLENGDATNEDVLIQLCKTDEMPMNDVAESILVGDVMVISNKPKYIYNHVVELKEKFPACTIFSALNIVEEATKQKNHQKFLENATKILEHNTNVSHLFVARVAKLSDEKIQRVFDYIESGVDNDFAIVYGECDDVNIKEHYEQAISDAKIKRNQLKSGREDLTDNKILNFFSNNKCNIVKTIDLLGLSTFEYAYTSKLDGVKRLSDAVEVIYNNLGKENFELLKQRLADKSLEPQEKISKLRAIAGLMNHCSDEELHSYIELIRPNKPTKDEIKTAREIWANPKARFDDKFNTFCETFGIEKDNQKVIDFFNKRATLNGKGFKILNNVKESDIAKLLEVEVLRKRNLTEWNDAIDKKIFSTIGVQYSPELSAKLKLTDNRYLSEILSSNNGFRDNFGELVDELIAKPDKSIKEVFDEMPQNIETKRQYDILGIPYDRFTTADKNSYKTVKVSTDAEKTKQDALRNLEADFNDSAFKALPKEETQKIFDALEKELGIKAITKQEPVYDLDGFIIGKKDVTHFFIGEKQIDFSHLGKMMSVIKKTINENEFWTKTASDPTVDESKTTIYNHLTKLRDGEIHNASKMKANEETEIEVHQTDMNNLSHSLFLGNHGACCTAVGTGCNQYAAPRYCMDKCISAIEVMDGKEFVGNTMCYFAFVDGELSFVMDNIELNGKYQFNDSIRDTFMEYAKQLCSEMGLPDIPIYAGPYRHKFNMDPYEFSPHKITIIGSTNGDPTYIDFVTGRYVIDGEKVNDIEMYRIR